MLARLVLVSSRRHIEPCVRFSRTRLSDVLHHRHSASRTPRPVGSWRDDGPVEADQSHPDGHIPDDEARGWIKNAIEPGTEVYLAWQGDNELSVIDAQRTVNGSNAPREDLYQLAFDLFVGEPMVETEWDSAMALLGVAKPTARNGSS